jgi:hypothetical protein
VLVENEAMLEVFDQVGAQRREIEPGVLQVDVALPDDPALLPAPGLSELFRELARGLLPRHLAVPVERPLAARSSATGCAASWRGRRAPSSCRRPEADQPLLPVRYSSWISWSYSFITVARLTFIVGVSSPPSIVNSRGRMV